MALAPFVIALTGSIGSGKSEVGALFAARGVTVLDADVLAREVSLPGSPGLSEVEAEFGGAVIDKSTGALNRKVLGALVFSDAAKRKKLEQILHPRIRALFLEKLAELKKKPQPPPWIIAYLVPLLFESGFKYTEMDLIAVVSASREICIERVMARDGGTRAEAEARLAAQLPMEEKERRADIVIRNDGSKSELKTEFDAFFKKLETLTAKKRGQKGPK